MKLNLIGQQFGRVQVVGEGDRKLMPNGARVRVWLLRCICGKELTAMTSQLRTKNPTQSCGCINRERLISQNRKHGLAYRVPEYNVWKGMRQRCADRNSKNYATYGAMGITVCERWDSFENFYADMGPRPSPIHSIDRIRGKEGYGPDNCRWATPAMQSANRKITLKVEYEGRLLPLTEVAAALGLPRRLLYDQYKGRGLALSDAIANAKSLAASEVKGNGRRAARRQ